MTKIFLAGATGFIGLHILKRLVEQNHSVTCLVRKKSKNKIEKLNFKNVSIVEGEFSSPDSWTHQINDHEIFINAIGIIRETKLLTFKQVHENSPIEAFKKCAEFNIQKVIQISALGSDEKSSSQYHITKKNADDFLKSTNLNYLILRPSIVYGHGDKSMSFFSAFSALPIHLIPSHGRFRLSPIFIDDLIFAVNEFVKASNDSESKICLDVGGDTIITVKDLFKFLALKQNNKYFIQINIHSQLITLAGKITDLLKKGPISSDEWAMLKRENFCETTQYAQHFNRSPISLNDGIEQVNTFHKPYSFEALSMLFPLLRITIAFIWIYTGVISAFITPKEISIQLLNDVGIFDSTAIFLLYFTSISEIILGLLVLKSKFTNLLSLIQILLIISFTLILSFRTTGFWLDPFGPLSKNIPLLGGIIVLWAYERTQKGQN